MRRIFVVLLAIAAFIIFFYEEIILELILKGLWRLSTKIYEKISEILRGLISNFKN